MLCYQVCYRGLSRVFVGIQLQSCGAELCIRGHLHVPCLRVYRRMCFIIWQVNMSLFRSRSFHILTSILLRKRFHIVMSICLFVSMFVCSLLLLFRLQAMARIHSFFRIDFLPSGHPVSRNMGQNRLQGHQKVNKHYFADISTTASRSGLKIAPNCSSGDLPWVPC